MLGLQTLPLPDGKLARNADKPTGEPKELMGQNQSGPCGPIPPTNWEDRKFPLNFALKLSLHSSS
jgi:hypothetical protein